MAKDPEERSQARWRITQFLMACVFGSVVYLQMIKEESPTAALFGALIAGFGGSWLVTFLIAWWRFGWKAARSMRMG